MIDPQGYHMLFLICKEGIPSQSFILYVYLPLNRSFQELQANHLNTH
jgi:hypothetical protein